jgi:hypothetical protein
MPDDLSPQALTWAHFMASIGYEQTSSRRDATGTANDKLVEICCPGISSIALTGRELRRSKERRAAVKTRLEGMPKAKGFA